MKCAVISEKISNTKCSKLHFSQKLKLKKLFNFFCATAEQAQGLISTLRLLKSKPAVIMQKFWML